MNVDTWAVFGDSVQGSRHARKNIPNQDAVDWRPRGPSRAVRVALAVSDGHGSNKSFRSHFGSRFAVTAAMHCLEEIIRLHEDGTPHGGSFSRLHDTLENDVPRQIELRWKRYVTKHIQLHPFLQADLALLSPKEQGEVQQNPFSVYGATLRAAAVTESFIALLKLGDGNSLAVADDGEVVHPFPDDLLQIGEDTESLSGDDCCDSFEVRFQILAGAPPALIVLSTDGYGKSFTTLDAFSQIGPDILHMLYDKGLQHVVTELPKWLADTSRRGSGDDITLGALFRLGARTPRKTLDGLLHPPS